MISLRALKIDRGPSNKSAQCGQVVDRVSFVLFVTQKAFKSKVNSISLDPSSTFRSTFEVRTFVTRVFFALFKKFRQSSTALIMLKT